MKQVIYITRPDGHIDTYTYVLTNANHLRVFRNIMIEIGIGNVPYKQVTITTVQ